MESSRTFLTSRAHFQVLGRGAESRTWARGQLKHGLAPSNWMGPRPKSSDLQKEKKRSSPKFRLFFRPKSNDSFYYSMQFRWAPFELMGPLDTMGLGVIVPPCPPYRRSWSLASKVKSLTLALASKPQVLENCPVLGSKTALFLEWLKFCRSVEKFFSRPFFFGDRLKKIFEDLFLEDTCLCVLGPWPRPRAFLSLASRVSVLGRAVLGVGLGFFCVPGLGLEPCVLDSTSGYYPL